MSKNRSITRVYMPAMLRAPHAVIEPRPIVGPYQRTQLEMQAVPVPVREEPTMRMHEQPRWLGQPAPRMVPYAQHVALVVVACLATALLAALLVASL